MSDDAGENPGASGDKDANKAKIPSPGKPLTGAEPSREGVVARALVSRSDVPADKATSDIHAVAQLWWKLMSGMLGTAAFFAAIVAVVAQVVHGHVAPILITLAGIMGFGILALLGIILRRGMKKYGVGVLWQAAGWAAAVTLLGVLVSGGVIGLTTALAVIKAEQKPAASATVQHSSDTQRPHATATQTSAASSSGPAGSILSPLSNANNIPLGNTLLAYGTDRNLKPNQHLLLFFQFADRTGTYFGGDPHHQIVSYGSNGVWSLMFYISQDARPGQQITLYLSELGPLSWKYINTPSPTMNNYWNNGFPSPTPGPDSIKLAQVNFTVCAQNGM